MGPLLIVEGVGGVAGWWSGVAVDLRQWCRHDD